MKKLRGSLLLIAASTIWGITFIAQTDAMEHIGPFTFNCIRSLIGAAALLPVIPLYGRGLRRTAEGIPDGGRSGARPLLTGGILCGLLLFAASNLQQFGIKAGDSIGKAGFITSFYIILVPLLGVFFKKRPPVMARISVAAAAVGLCLLCINDGFRVETADLLYIACALFFAVHILTVSVYSPFVNGAALSCIQFAVTGVLSAVCMFVFERPDFEAVLAARTSLLYAGILACGVAYTLQIIGQKDLDPTAASLLLCLESVVSVLAGWLVLGQTLTARELAGCAVMLAATVLAQLPDSMLRRRAE